MRKDSKHALFSPFYGESRLRLALILSSAFATIGLSACADNVNQTQVTRLNPTTNVAPLGSVGGAGGIPGQHQSQSYGISRSSVGGSSDISGQSPTFRVKGWVRLGR